MADQSVESTREEAVESWKIHEKHVYFGKLFELETKESQLNGGEN